jgi:hypothetical protein
MSDTREKTAPAASGDDWLQLPECEALSPDAASEITRARRTKVIVLAGAAESGKTTLLTSIYEAFQEAPFADHLFAGSSTLHGFESRCHEGRFASGLDRPRTSHTPPGEGVRLLHLALVAVKDFRQRTDLLITDISGELFREARDSLQDCRKLTIISRADRLVCLLDGAKLASAKHRHKALTDVRSLLRSIVEAKMLPGDTPIDVMFSKWDLVEVPAVAVGTREFANECELRIRDTMRGCANPITFRSIAARPQLPGLPFAFGLAEVVRIWCLPPVSRRSPLGWSHAGGKSGREFDYFGQRNPCTRGGVLP